MEALALTLWAEARNEPDEGIAAIAWVVRNRAENPRWWGSSIASVVTKPWQFSCWNAENRPESQLVAMRNPVTKESPKYLKCRRIAQEVLRGAWEDTSRGADHYCTAAVAPATKWAKGREPVVIIGSHAFYRVEL